jgi:digeranylgeranylglycerophospholipid reductase
MKREVDVLVVGAGPAGSGAGRAAAEAGARTLVIDMKKEIGTPVQCGEIIGQSVLAMAGIRLPPHAVRARQQFTRFIIDRRLRIDNHQPYWRSVSVERKILDKYLAEQAARAGASVMADAKLQSLELRDGIVESAIVLRHGEAMEVAPKVVIAADGVHSTVARLTGTTLYGADAVARGVEFEMVAKRPIPPCMQVFIEPEIGLGYGWIIPKGDRRANVGLGFLGRKEARRSLLTDWIVGNPIVSQYFDPDQVLEVKIGDAPVPGFLGGPRRGNVLFAGDAAGQTLAFVGEGIMPSFICGSIAGRTAALAAGQGPEGLDGYDVAIRKLMGEEMSLGSGLRDAIVATWGRPDITKRAKSVLSGLAMCELITMEELQEASLGELPEKSLAAEIRKRAAAAGSDIRPRAIKEAR